MNHARIVLSAIALVMPGLAMAGTMWVPVISAVPTMGEWGLISLAVGVGGLGAWLLSRKK
jgi:predicted membrane-bound spermidine synthase